MERVKSVVSIRIFDASHDSDDNDSDGGSRDLGAKITASAKKSAKKAAVKVESDVKIEILPEIEREGAGATTTADDANMPPLTDFEGFVKWLSNYWLLEYNVAVLKKKTDLPVPPMSKKRSQSLKNQKSKISLELTTSLTDKTSVAKFSMYDSNTVPIIAYYDYFDNLVEIEILHCPFKVPLDVIKIIRICARVYPQLTKFVVRRNQFHPMMTHELSQLINVSNISEVYFNSVYLKQGNYYHLLDHPSNLKYLTLCGCSINDGIVKEIAKRLNYGHSASVVLLTLDLSVNNITDEGARHLGEMLRNNRHLLHLNLSSNRITDVGTAFLFNTLKEFPLTETETVEMKKRKVEYYKQRTETFKKFLYDIWMKSKQLQLTRHTIASKTVKMKETPAPKKADEIKKLQSMKSGSELAENMTAQKMGVGFVDLFDTHNTVSKDGKLYSIGNFRLASINLVYNNLSYLGLRHIVDVLKYQSKIIEKPARCSGLLKIELAGNCLPIHSYEYEMMLMFLKRNVIEHTPVHSTPARKGLSFSKKSGAQFY